MKYETNPAILLRQLAAKAVDVTNNQTDRQDLKNVWSGVGFSLCGQQMVAAMGEVTEIMPVPKYTFVPGAKPWVLGLANVRGKLLTIVDIELFFGSRLTGSRSNYRVLVIEINNMYIGLVVSKVFGLQHLNKNSIQTYDQSNIETYSKFIDAQSIGENSEWLRLSLEKLVEDEAFANASLYSDASDKERHVA